MTKEEIDKLEEALEASRLARRCPVSPLLQEQAVGIGLRLIAEVRRLMALLDEAREDGAQNQ